MLRTFNQTLLSLRVTTSIYYYSNKIDTELQRNLINSNFISEKRTVHLFIWERVLVTYGTTTKKHTLTRVYCETEKHYWEFYKHLINCNPTKRPPAKCKWTREYKVDSINIVHFLRYTMNILL